MRPSTNFGYNLHDLRELGPFPAKRAFRISTKRLNLATQSGDNALDPVFSNEGHASAIKAARQLALSPPNWIDFESVERGQALGRRYFSCLSITLGNLSLIGGFGAAKINRVLVKGSRLSRMSDGRGYDPLPRLVETAAWLLSVLKSVRYASHGFEETANVRALHSMIRAHLLSKSWDCEALDFPINQEQMLSTLMGFSYNGIWGLRRMGVRITSQEAEDYIHLWAYIGHMLGIDADLLPRCYEEAKATTLQLIPRIIAPDSETRAIIEHLHERRKTRLGLPYSVQAAMSRYFLPEAYADALGLEPHPLAELAVGLGYRALGHTVSAVGRFRPEALEQWEIERVSRRLEAVLAQLRYTVLEETTQHPNGPSRVTSAREVLRALLSL